MTRPVFPRPIHHLLACFFVRVGTSPKAASGRPANYIVGALPLRLVRPNVAGLLPGFGADINQSPDDTSRKKVGTA